MKSRAVEENGHAVLGEEALEGKRLAQACVRFPSDRIQRFLPVLAAGPETALRVTETESADRLCPQRATGQDVDHGVDSLRETRRSDVSGGTAVRVSAIFSGTPPA